VDSGVPKEAHWRHVANTIEPSVCRGDAALRQSSLTTYYVSYHAAPTARTATAEQLNYFTPDHSVQVKAGHVTTVQVRLVSTLCF